MMVRTCRSLCLLITSFASVAPIKADGAVVMQMLNCASSCRLWL
jgi:hypothetical protein